ncbi:MAG: carotenoid biosynthesis protein [Saprospiraceae bacterium]|nr:carotenoid biosynthesis protein [Saprospiraceae bacterium]
MNSAFIQNVMGGTAKLRISRFLISSSYVAGLIGMAGPYLALFLLLTPFNLLLSFGILLWNHFPRNAGLWGYVAGAWAVGYFAEVAGVSTGVIFGEYAYGDVFGWKILETPLLIGVNWAMLVYIACETTSRYLPIHWPVGIKWGIASLLPVLLDVLIEPVAIRTGMWHWYGKMPPLQNYLGWYAVSLLMSALYFRFIGQANRNPVASLLLLMQLLFFLGMNLLSLNRFFL